MHQGVIRSPGSFVTVSYAPTANKALVANCADSRINLFPSWKDPCFEQHQLTGPGSQIFGRFQEEPALPPRRWATYVVIRVQDTRDVLSHVSVQDGLNVVSNIN